MSVTPDDFLKSAHALAAAGQDEINQRNAISRAYYASYHKACSVFAPDGKDRQTGMHSGYLEQLTECIAGSIQRQVGVKLGAIYSGRITADYKIADSVPAKSFAMQIARAADLFKLLDTALANSQPAAAAATTPQAKAKPATLRIVK